MDTGYGWDNNLDHSIHLDEITKTYSLVFIYLVVFFQNIITISDKRGAPLYSPHCRLDGGVLVYAFIMAEGGLKQCLFGRHKKSQQKCVLHQRTV